MVALFIIIIFIILSPIIVFVIDKVVDIIQMLINKLKNR